MDDQTISLLRKWAAEYNTTRFIEDDPVQFPHRYTRKQDIEISAFVTAWISYGRRSHILAKAEELHQLMGDSPYQFIRDGESSFLAFPDRSEVAGVRDTFYRFYTYSDLQVLCLRLKEIYDRYDSLEDALPKTPGSTPIVKLQTLFASVPGILHPHPFSVESNLCMLLKFAILQTNLNKPIAP